MCVTKTCLPYKARGRLIALEARTDSLASSAFSIFSSQQKVAEQTCQPTEYNWVCNPWPCRGRKTRTFCLQLSHARSLRLCCCRCCWVRTWLRHKLFWNEHTAPSDIYYKGSGTPGEGWHKRSKSARHKTAEATLVPNIWMITNPRKSQLSQVASSSG